MKPKAVIFSSMENLSIARDFSNILSDSVDCTVWRDLPFALANYTQRDLAVFGKRYDFALLIFGYEDRAVIKGENYSVTRDNVVYELGLMSGLIGADRCFIIECVSDSISNPHLPTDIKGITTVRFDTDENKRMNIIHDCVKPIISTTKMLGIGKHINEDLLSQLSAVGMSMFYSKRDDFMLRKSDKGESLPSPSDYLNIANKSIKIVAFTYELSNKFGQLDRVFIAKLKSSPNFTITISLLNPFDPSYYSSCYKTHYRDNPDILISEAKHSVELLRKFRDTLDVKSKKRFNLKFHNTALFEAAILIDDDEDTGRIQVEIKPYAASVYGAYSFEIRRTDSNPIFYDKIKGSYDQLLDEATSIDEIKST